MTIQTTLAYDAISANVGSLPKGSQVAGYSTGSGIVPWTAAQWAAHPGAVRIDQDPGASDATADVLDVEAGAATVADCPGWVARARGARAKNTRTGQREPAIYVNRSNITAVANALTAAHVTGVGLWVADWDLTEQEAEAEVTSASGPFPVIGVQYNSGHTYDTSVFSVPWLHAVSGAAPPPAKGPYRHQIGKDSTYSFTRWATDLRHESRAALLAFNKSVTPAHLSQAHYNLLAALAAADEAAEAAKVTRPSMGTGTVIYTKNP